jgi:anti-anti-sigma factor
VANALVNRRVLHDGTVVLDVRGELDVAVDDALREVLVDTITTGRPPAVIVSMRHVSFVDSTGLGALVAGYNAARALDVRYVVQHVAPFVEKQLHASGLSDVLLAPAG